MFIWLYRERFVYYLHNNSRTGEHAFLYSTETVHLKPENKARLCAMTRLESCSLQSQWSAVIQLAVGSLWLALSWLRVLILRVQICWLVYKVFVLMKILQDAQSLQDLDVQQVPCPREVLPMCNYCQYSIYNKSTSPCQKKVVSGSIHVNYREKMVQTISLYRTTSSQSVAILPCHWLLCTSWWRPWRVWAKVDGNESQLAMYSLKDG